MTEVEPHAFASGPTIVAAFQVARISSGGGADIGWATSLNGGISWSNGYLPGLTQFGPGGGPNSAASDAAVAYDAKHGVWLICTLPLGNASTRRGQQLQRRHPLEQSRLCDHEPGRRQELDRLRQHCLQSSLRQLLR